MRKLLLETAPSLRPLPTSVWTQVSNSGGYIMAEVGRNTRSTPWASSALSNAQARSRQEGAGPHTARSLKCWKEKGCFHCPTLVVCVIWLCWVPQVVRPKLQS